MDYFISLLEGIITFVSPCLLPMLPLYLIYFAGGGTGKGKAVKNASGFIAGFTVVFTALGAFAGYLGGFLVRYSGWVNLITGAIVLLFGLNYLGVFSLPFFKGQTSRYHQPKNLGFFSSVLFGMVFSVGWTPCVGTFLGSALMLAANAQSSLKGILMLFCFSMGLGIPFLISAVLINQLKGVFDFIKRNYELINRISGILLVLLGIAMMTGLMGKLLALLTF